jgi:hypothetical protein
LVLLSAIALFFLVGQSSMRRPFREPHVQGKPLSFWLRSLDPRNPGTATVAIEEVGTNAIPFLMYLAQKRHAWDEVRGVAKPTSDPGPP